MPIDNITNNIFDFCDRNFSQSKCYGAHLNNVDNCYQSFFYRNPTKPKCCQGTPSQHNGIDYCPSIVYHYFCRYYTRYGSEIQYALETQLAFLSQFKEFNIVSFGCGACPELLGFLQLYNRQNFTQQINFTGIDTNPNWDSIRNTLFQRVNQYYPNVKHQFSNTIQNNVPCNILILNYVISHIYNHNAGNLAQIIRMLYNSLVTSMPPNSLIVICDENNENIIGAVQQFTDYISLHKSIICDDFHFRRSSGYNIPMFGQEHPTGKVFLTVFTSNSSFDYNVTEWCTGMQRIIRIV